jgi:hypothetical protein
MTQIPTSMPWGHDSRTPPLSTRASFSDSGVAHQRLRAHRRAPQNNNNNNNGGGVNDDNTNEVRQGLSSIASPAGRSGFAQMSTRNSKASPAASRLPLPSGVDIVGHVVIIFSKRLPSFSSSTRIIAPVYVSFSFPSLFTRRHLPSTLWHNSELR